jgi:hypothetical protein
MLNPVQRLELQEITRNFSSGVAISASLQNSSLQHNPVIPFISDGLFCPLGNIFYDDASLPTLPADILLVFSGLKQTVKKLAFKVRSPFLKAYTNALSDVSTASDPITRDNSFCVLLLLPLCTLGIVPKARTTNVSDVRGSRTTNVSDAQQQKQIAYTLQQLDIWNSGPAGRAALYGALIEELRVISRTQRTAIISPQLQQIRNIRRSKSLFKDGQWSRSFHTLTSHGIHDPKQPEILEQLQLLHPQFFQPLNVLPTLEENRLQLTDELILKSLRTFKKGTASGCEGFKPQYFLDILSACATPESRTVFSNNLLPLIRAFVHGSSSPLMNYFISTSSLHALVKGHVGDKKVRPVAVGISLQRLISKICLISLPATVVTSLKDLGQMGVNVRGGTEAIIHSVRELLTHRIKLPQEIKNYDPIALMKLDFTNAFNLISRQVILEELQSQIPSFVPWFNALYGKPSVLISRGDRSLLSAVGVKQGDPLGPLLFSLGLSPLLRSIKSRFSSMEFKGFYLDDGTFVGPVDSLLHIISLIQESGPTNGLLLNLSKSEVGTLQFNGDLDVDLSCFPSEMVRCSSEGVLLLGSAVGTSAFVSAHAHNYVQKIAPSVTALLLLEDPQMEYHLIKNCGGISRLNHVMRTSPSEDIHSALVVYDTFILQMFEAMLKDSSGTFSFGDEGEKVIARLLITMPIKDGGFGFFKASQISSAAYLGSLVLTNTLVIGLLPTVFPLDPITNFDDPFGLGDPASIYPETSVVNTAPSSTTTILVSAIPPLIAKINLLISPLAPVTFSSLVSSGECFIQSFLSDLIVDFANDGFFASHQRHLSERTQKLILVHRTLGSGDFLTIPPTNGNFFVMKPQVFRCAVKRRLGLPIFSIDGLSCAACVGPSVNRLLNIYGDHASCCVSMFQQRSKAVLKELLSCTKDAGYHAVVEAPGLLYPSLDRPGDMLIYNFSGSKPLAVDVSVVSSMRGFSDTTFEPLTNVNLAAAEKITTYASRCAVAGIGFASFICGTNGGFDKGAMGLMDFLNLRIVERRNNGHSGFLSFLSVRQRISKAVALFENSSIMHIGNLSNANSVAG